MGLFSRGRDRGFTRNLDARAPQIEAFWAWWRDVGAVSTAEAIAAQSLDGAAAALSAAVSSIDPELDWELGPGQGGAEHVLMVTPAGDSTKRSVAHRWLREAPAPDATWEYAAVRRAAADPADVHLEFEGVDIDVASVVFVSRRRGPALDVTVFHPQLLALDPERRAFASFWLLDCVLGEIAVETWIGTVNCSEGAPADAQPLTALAAAVAELSAEYLDDEGRPRWELGTVTYSSGAEMLVVSQRPLRPATDPLMDTYVGVTLAYRGALGANGMPPDPVLQDLRRFEDLAQERLGRSGAVVAHQTLGGKRTIHLFVDGTTPAAEQVRALAPGWTHGKVQIEARYDPDWEAVSHLQ